jgi:hypothetical protein
MDESTENIPLDTLLDMAFTPIQRQAIQRWGKALMDIIINRVADLLPPSDTNKRPRYESGFMDDPEDEKADKKQRTGDM